MSSVFVIYTPFLSFFGKANQVIGTSTPDLWWRLPRVEGRRLVRPVRDS